MDFEKFQLIKRDCRELRSLLFGYNIINDWQKLIVIYNIYLFISHIYVLYMFTDYFGHSTNSFEDDFKKIFITFFVICNLQNTYRYFILNIAKLNYRLAKSMYNNTNEYFI
jgi:hypothetical protein